MEKSGKDEGNGKGDYNGVSGHPLESQVGKELVLDLVGSFTKKSFSPEGQQYNLIPFGRYKGIKVFVDNHKFLPRDGGIKLEGGFQPGDRVKVLITGADEEGFQAVVTENYYSFIPEYTALGRPIRVKLTARSERDRRNVISSPSNGGGFYGVFTVVKNVKGDGIPEGFEKCRVVVTEFTKNHSTGGYVIFAEPADKLILRDAEREMYRGVVEDYKLGRIGSSIDDLAHGLGMIPCIDKLFFGVPGKSLGIALYFKSWGERYILFRRGVDDISQLTPEESVKEFADKCYKKQMKVALATEHAKEQLDEAIGAAGFERIDLEERIKG